MSITDDFIGIFSPRAKFKRLQYKRANKIMERSYEGASRTRRTAGWHAGSTSANTETGAGIETLRNRSRDLVRNNSHANKGIAVIANNVVGKGIMASLESPTDALTTRHRDLWRAWAASQHVSYDCGLNLYGVQQLVMRSIVESGEVLIRRRFVEDDHSPVPIQLQVLEADHLVTSRIYRNSENGNRVIQGIELDENDCVVAYHLYENHPGSMGAEFNAKNPLSIVRVEAENILHIYRIDRPGQLRGVPWLAPTMIRLRDLCEYEDAELIRQKVASCFSAFVYDLEAPIDSTESEEFEIERLEPGMIEHLPPGKDIKFGSPPTMNGESYKMYTSSVLHAVASGLGITYESLTGDLSQVNFSSARMGWLEMQRSIESWRMNMMITQFLDPLFKDWFVPAAELIGENMNNVKLKWTPPRREMIDPTREVPAKIRSVRAGFESLSDVIRQNGLDPDLHFSEIAKDNAILDELGLTFDSDPRKVTQVGIAQAEQEETQDADQSSEE